MAPSVTDAPNEFMSVKLMYDQEQDRYVVRQEYHDVLSEMEVATLSDEVVESVANLKPYYQKNSYHDYAEIKTEEQSLSFMAPELIGLGICWCLRDEET